MDSQSSTNRIAVQNLLPIGIIVLSLISIPSSILSQNYLSLIVSVMGLIGAGLYLKNGKPIWHFIELWIIAQVPYIEKQVFATPYSDAYNSPIYCVYQTIKVTWYFHLNWSDKMIMIGINFFPLILIGLLMYLKIPYLKKHI